MDQRPARWAWSLKRTSSQSPERFVGVGAEAPLGDGTFLEG